ncbi:MAG: hypothetical protein R3D29_08345 [Nitratireductor sp.]
MIGAGGVGANIAHMAANTDLAHTISWSTSCRDWRNRLPWISIMQAALPAPGLVKGDMDMSLIAGSEVVVVTAGSPAHPACEPG